MVDVVELSVQAHGVAQVHADALVHLDGALVVLSHQALNNLQALCRGLGLVQLDAGTGSQLVHAVLAEVLHAAADVAAPLVLHGVGLAVHGSKCQLVQPAADVALAVHVANGLAGAHGDAHDAVLTQAHSAGQSGNVAVVGNHNGDLVAQDAAQILSGAGVDVLHLGVEVFLAHLQEQAGDHALVVDVNTGGGNADAVHLAALLQDLGGSGLHGGQDAQVVVIGIGVDLRVPHNLFAVDGLAVDHGAHLAVRSAGVKADAGAVGVTAHALGLLEGSGLLIVGQSHYLKLTLVNALHEVLVELTAAAHGVGLLDALGQLVVAADVHLEAAPAPQQELHQTVHIVGIGLGHLGGVVNLALPGADLAAAALHSDAQGLGGAHGVMLKEQAQRHKALVQLRQVLYGNLNIQEFHVLPSFRVITGASACGPQRTVPGCRPGRFSCFHCSTSLSAASIAKRLYNLYFRVFLGAVAKITAPCLQLLHYIGRKQKRTPAA